MKKSKISALLAIALMMILLLTSCDVHFGSIHYDVPWWYIAIPVLVFDAAVFFIVGKSISSDKYVCPKCGESFHPKWWAAAVSLHMGDDRLFRCPHCKNRSFCRKE